MDDNVVGPLILILLAVGAGIQKLIAQRQAGERRGRAGQIKAKDLPEKTRRQLYGTQKVPGARSPVRPERVGDLARQERTAQEEMTIPRRQPVKEPAPFQPRVAKPARPRPPVARPAPPPQARPAPPEPLPPQLEPPTQPEQAGRVREMMERARRQMERPRPPVRRRPAEAPPAPEVARRRPPRRPSRVQAEPQPAPTRPGLRKRPLQALFAEMDSVRRGIIFHEILGPPKAFR